MKLVYSAAEDKLSISIIERLVREVEARIQIAVSLPPKGQGELKKKLPDLIRLSANIPVILLTDLDMKECAPGFLSEWLGRLEKPEDLLFRVAVREVESWLLADREGFSEFSKIPLTKLPDNPELLNDPKQTLLNLVFRYSPKKIKNDLVVNYGSGPAQGLEYNEQLTHFVFNVWNPITASARADSLARTLRRIDDLSRRY